MDQITRRILYKLYAQAGPHRSVQNQLPLAILENSSESTGESVHWFHTHIISSHFMRPLERHLPLERGIPLLKLPTVGSKGARADPTSVHRQVPGTRHMCRKKQQERTRSARTYGERTDTQAQAGKARERQAHSSGVNYTHPVSGTEKPLEAESPMKSEPVPRAGACAVSTSSSVVELRSYIWHLAPSPSSLGSLRVAVLPASGSDK
ncbi:hypothetical protein CB1_000949003 [Camelus ferus]|nr:hypothetical protein CB1_000949003 [Camelus ferus]